MVLASLLLLATGCRTTQPPTSNHALRAMDEGVSEIFDRDEVDVDLVLNESSGLNDYLRFAALNNPGLEAAFNEWQADVDRIPQDKALPDPRFNYGYFIEEIETRVGPQNQRFGISQTFPWLGKRRLRGELADSRAQVAYERYRAGRFRLFYEVKSAYYEMAYLGRAIAVTRENQGLMRHLESVAQAKFRAGNEMAGVIKAQVELGILEDRLLSLEDMKGPLQARLNVALNRSPDAPLAWPESFQYGETDLSEDLMVSNLKARNPRLAELASEISKSEKAVVLAEKEFWPDLTLGADYVETGAARMPGVQDSGQDPIMVTASINLPIWWGKYRAGVREAERRRDAALLRHVQEQNALESDFKMALYKLRDARRKINLFNDTLTPLARNAFGVAEKAYESGSVDFFELIDAQRLLLELELSYQRALADGSLALAEIEMLIGEDLF